MLDSHRRTGYILFAVLVAQVILISFQVRSERGVPVIESVTFGVFSEIQRAASGLVTGVRDNWGRYVSLRNVTEENASLKQRIADLEVNLQEARALAWRSESLRAILDYKRAVPLPTLGAEVIAGDATPWFRTLTINRGTTDGLQADLAVLAPSGVVGRLVGRLGLNAAKVQLLVDRNAAAGAMIERSRSAGIVSGGSGDPPLRLDYVSNQADVKVGDRVVTSGSEGIYPKGFLIGLVESVGLGTGRYQDSGLYQNIGVRPEIDFDALEDVLVVTVRRPTDVPLGETQ